MTNKKYFLATMIAVGTLLTTACGKKSDSSAVNTTITAATPTAACTAAGACTGVTNPGLLISASSTVSSTGVQVDFAMDIFGEATRFNSADPKAIITYNGPAAMAGYIRIQATGASICGASTGEYLMQASSQGNLILATLTNARMVSVSGPNANRMEVLVSQAVLSNSQDPQLTSKTSTSNRLYMVMQVTSVNGQPCNAVITSY